MIDELSEPFPSGGGSHYTDTVARSYNTPCERESKVDSFDYVSKGETKSGSSQLTS